jgi:heterodisulfide reductase subunit D
MNDMTFEAALSGRLEEMLVACTKCGKCVEVCPSVQPAGISGLSSPDIIAGVLQIARTGDGPGASRRWATSCMLSGECVKACDYGVNPRFLLAMARVAMLKQKSELPERRRDGVQRYRQTSRDVAVLSRIQLDAAVLERLGQGAASVAKAMLGEQPLPLKGRQPE